MQIAFFPSNHFIAQEILVVTTNLIFFQSLWRHIKVDPLVWIIISGVIFWIGSYLRNRSYQRHIHTLSENLKLRLEEQTAALATQNQELIEANEALAQSEEIMLAAQARFENIFHAVPVACYTYDREGTIMEWNRAAEDLYGYRGDEVLQRSMFDLFVEEDEKNRIRDLIQRIFEGEYFNGLEFEEQLADGTIRYVRTNTFPLRDPRGHVIAGISANLDVTEVREANQAMQAKNIELANYVELLTSSQNELEIKTLELTEANKRLERLAIIDGLTGLVNHRHFQEKLKNKLSGGHDESQIALIMVDVDHFKRFNDRYGHPAGDETLRNVASILKQCCDSSDIAARYGGEEFAVIVQNTSGAVALAERIRCEVMSCSCKYGPITISLGIAYSYAGFSSDELVELADNALYQSKQNGRNRWTVSSGPVKCGESLAA